MCGRFTLTVDEGELNQQFPDFAFPQGVAPRYNIAPGQPVLALANDDKRTADFFTWGLIPSWAKDPAIGNRMINARAETLAEKPSFRGSLKYKRCVIFADGFYEWKAVAGSKAKVPHYVKMKDEAPFAFAGLWDNWQSPDGSLIRSCTIITTAPNPLMAAIHNRMPAILEHHDIPSWLDSAPRAAESLQPLLAPYSAERMTAHVVSTMVNRPANDSPECIAPA